MSNESTPENKAKEPQHAKPKPNDKINPNRVIDIDKVVVNIGVGESGEKLMRGEKVLELITNQKPVRTLSKTTNKDFAIRKKMPIGCKVTLREEDAKDFITRALWVKENKIANYSFDKFGNFSFGIPDYTDFQGMKYDPDIGIFGMDISVSLKRNGFRVAHRRRARSRVPQKHRISTQESMDYVREQFNVEIIEVE